MKSFYIIVWVLISQSLFAADGELPTVTTGIFSPLSHYCGESVLLSGDKLYFTSTTNANFPSSGCDDAGLIRVFVWDALQKTFIREEKVVEEKKKFQIISQIIVLSRTRLLNTITKKNLDSGKTEAEKQTMYVNNKAEN